MGRSFQRRPQSLNHRLGAQAPEEEKKATGSRFGLGAGG